MTRRISVLICLLAGCGGAALPLGNDGGTVDGATSATKWYETCGDPVCSTWKPKSSAALCTTEKAGDPCAAGAASCDPKNDCNSLLTCATSDPRMQPGGCPISRRRYKKDVRYLGTDELVRYYDEVLRLKLASYRYKNASSDSPARLGFMIDDVAPSVSVDPERDLVDLYGYTSMAIAGLKVQAAELRALREEVAALKAERTRRRH